jgi:hypothetical protein
MTWIGEDMRVLLFISGALNIGLICICHYLASELQKSEQIITAARELLEQIKDDLTKE